MNFRHERRSWDDLYLLHDVNSTLVYFKMVEMLNDRVTNVSGFFDQFVIFYLVVAKDSIASYPLLHGHSNDAIC